MKNENSLKFCDLLSNLIKESQMTHIEFYKALGIKKPYFYDIIGGKTNPPPPQKQFEIIRILKPDIETCSLFFELAAQERHEVPADIAIYLKSESTRKKIRQKSDYKKSVKKIIGE